ncbi:hypothetical protein HYX01_04660 [Candidatus Woesearchaeota archaeon]|nr:hypothetical protein [Candidatus Woesearchaeota archaeon]
MANKSGNFYGVMLIVLMVITLIGLFTAKPSTTGFTVKENYEYSYSAFDVPIHEDEQGTCLDGSLYGECSTLIKPKFCVNGDLVDYCALCGCDEGNICSNNKCVKSP